ncbi:hypothetical protein ACEWY4_018043 [Coilia grayii]|uniref:Aftiphilin clathrin-binding box domain-containing protein n=1 Tax=Coilia grayii TaxID=363190 RepID=A0ABD1JIQ7_9TELE
MEPDVIHMYSSSPPPMEDGAEEEEDEFGDFSGVPNSISLSELDTPSVTYGQSQSQALTAATSPPEILNNGSLSDHWGPAKANGVVPGQGDGTPGRTVSTEELKQSAAEHHSQSPTTTYTDSKLITGRKRTEVDCVGCNGGPEDAARLTNGFAAFDQPGTPPLQSHAPVKSRGPEDSEATDSGAVENEDDFADFAAFSNTNSHDHNNDLSNQQPSWGNPFVAEWQATNDILPLNSDGKWGTSSVEETLTRDPCGTGIDLEYLPVTASEGLRNGDRGGYSWSEPDTTQTTDMDLDTTPHTALSQCTHQTEVTLNGEVQDGSEEDEEEGDEGVQPHSLTSASAQRCPDEHSEGRRDGSGNDSEPETETETSFGRPLSNDALEEFGDFSTTGSVPSPPLQEEMATPADDSQMAEDDDGEEEKEEEEFGDFGDFSSTSGGFVSGQEFTSFAYPQRPGTVASAITSDAIHRGFREDSISDTREPCSTSSRDPTQSECKADKEERSEDEAGNLPVSDSFADFHAAPVEGDAGGSTEDWTAFGEEDEEPREDTAAGGESWASWGPQQTTAAAAALSEETSEEDWREGQQQQQPHTVPPSCSTDRSRTDGPTAALLCRVQRLFQASFPEVPMTPVEEQVFHLHSFLKPAEQSPAEGVEGAAASSGVRDVWRQLQDIHNAFGLQHQWGGSHSNKMLLCSLGIDTRNILFTGQKKQPVIVPMYAASLGMLEPTKEPVKPISAAEMIASIAQMPAVATDISSTSTDTGQEALPPVQFDWSSSGLTNPLDASGGSSLLNLDFFGPVEELVPSSGASIPGQLPSSTTTTLGPQLSHLRGPQLSHLRGPSSHASGPPALKPLGPQRSHLWAPSSHTSGAPLSHLWAPSSHTSGAPLSHLWAPTLTPLGPHSHTSGPPLSHLWAPTLTPLGPHSHTSGAPLSHLWAPTLTPLGPHSHTSGPPLSHLWGSTLTPLGPHSHTSGPLLSHLWAPTLTPLGTHSHTSGPPLSHLWGTHSHTSGAPLSHLWGPTLTPLGPHSHTSGAPLSHLWAPTLTPLGLHSHTSGAPLSHLWGPTLTPLGPHSHTSGPPALTPLPLLSFNSFPSRRCDSFLLFYF